MIHADAVLCINMIHVAPWTATEALLRGAKDVLIRGGVLFLYGPYRRFGRHTAPSNEAFDVQLRAVIPPGVCVILNPSSSLPVRLDSSLQRLSICRPTISASCF